MDKQNRLSFASSPYLQQHANNPVDWYEWGEEALTKAREENKPLIISIGYAACHWCHVMARESFSDRAIAQLMNAHFVCIKVDREERPDIDRIYLEASQLLTGSAGWPLNAFALPDGRPFYAGTYFPPERWMEVLNQISNLFCTRYTLVLKAAKSLTEGIRGDYLPEVVDVKKFTREEYHTSYENHIRRIDFKLGGYFGEPKFVMPSGMEFLLQCYYQTGEHQALNAVIITLNALAKGGICDQIGGGFARYSTDQFWKVPHFEKMLYDNAQLISLYSHAYQLTNKALYSEIVEKTVSFAERELRHPEGGFYSSIDADSKHEEGKFYTWTKKEMELALDPETAELVIPFYQIIDQGNWKPNQNILHYKVDKEIFAAENGLSINEFNILLKNADQSLLRLRNQRVRPATDDKILTSWNALMLSGYVNAYKAFGKDAFLEGALLTASFLENHMLQPNGTLNRVFKDHQVGIAAFLDDYALLAESYIDLYEVTFDLHWLKLSEELAVHALDHFVDAKGKLFFYSSDQSEQLIARKHETTDNVIPASNSVFAHVLLKLGTLLEQQNYIQIAEQMILYFRNDIVRNGANFANWAMLMGKMVYPTFEVAVIGENALPVAREMQKNFLPTTLFAGGKEENLPILKYRLIDNKTAVYVCQDYTCRPPVFTAGEALEMIK